MEPSGTQPHACEFNWERRSLLAQRNAFGGLTSSKGLVSLPGMRDVPSKRQDMGTHARDQSRKGSGTLENKVKS